MKMKDPGGIDDSEKKKASQRASCQDRKREAGKPLYLARYE
jgi:hypothetical protein